MSLTPDQKKRAYNRLKTQLKRIKNDYQSFVDCSPEAVSLSLLYIKLLMHSLSTYGEFWEETKKLCPEVADQFPAIFVNKNNNKVTYYFLFSILK